MSYANPTREQFKAVYGLPLDQPACMLNLVRFREHAQYDPADADNAHLAITGREAYELYSAMAEGVFRKLGGKQLWVGQPQTTLIGPGDETWNYAFVAYYPTVQAFIDLVKSPEYQLATKHRTAALSDSRLIVTAPLTAGASFAPVSYLS